ncbi:hypothetical protein D3871_16765 [Noviherbaspirillum saxi]|uniref:Uncharacterized protein n=1 Tax=Noviherbaspirillum saxi TaxID=2320863 RepID=A0A3A3FIM9_9BURK|nr:hypothetical protein D3871_16765 [Noviherbaspirillum saxi]
MQAGQDEVDERMRTNDTEQRFLVAPSTPVSMSMMMAMVPAATASIMQAKIKVHRRPDVDWRSIYGGRHDIAGLNRIGVGVDSRGRIRAVGGIVGNNGASGQYDGGKNRNKKVLHDRPRVEPDERAEHTGQPRHFILNPHRGHSRKCSNLLPLCE